MAKIDVATRVEELAAPLLSSQGIELVDIEYCREGRNMILRLFLDKDGGINLDDCAAVSRELSELLDVHDVVPGVFSLEVSSPGLNRPLKKIADYERYLGRLIKVKTFEILPDDEGNRRKTFMGELLGLDNGTILIRLTEGQSAHIPLDRVAKANLEFEL